MPAQARNTGGAGCLITIGVITLIVANIYVVRPALRGLDFRSNRCTVVSRNLGEDDTHICDCGAYCQSLSPCVKVYVDYPGAPNATIFHASLSDLLHFPGCTLNNFDCAIRFSDNVAIAQRWLGANYALNSTLPCYTDGNSAVGAVEYSMRDVVFAILWPSLIIVFGLCMCGCAHGGDARCVGLAIVAAPIVLVAAIVGFFISLPRLCMDRYRAHRGQRPVPSDSSESSSPSQTICPRLPAWFRREQPPAYDALSLDHYDDAPPSIDAPFVPLLPLSSNSAPDASADPPPAYPAAAPASTARPAGSLSFPAAIPSSVAAPMSSSTL